LIDEFGLPKCPDQCVAWQKTTREKERHHAQYQINTQTITQITVVDAEPERQAEALSMMAERARFMARQPGFVSISLHRSLDAGA
jgi:heme-degrading monooxygenase HmoA